MAETVTRRDFERGAMLAILILDTILLAVLELFFLPLRFDGVFLPKLGDVPAPITVVLAGVTTPLLVIQAAKLVGRRASAVPLVVWIVTVLVVGLFGPGKDNVLLQDWRSLLLLAAGTLPGAMVLGGALAGGTAGKAAGGKRG
ncbi:hypothetical protein [Amycolatopsis sp. CA-230715]|uniref:hypothetical protein n=1 Tax=Amycolatopsis sp. CA-230715 TaxID=2745196 RepID=UPI001C010EA4|nr:hypothetical protein [Amycolatopsis sp. CA-230715]QWF82213.1 hypothetical protein HUW46_05650 [Amycolatopsis sp. CA-230715]